MKRKSRIADPPGGALIHSPAIDRISPEARAIFVHMLAEALLTRVLDDLGSEQAEHEHPHLEADVATYRELAVAALDALREKTLKNKFLTEDNRRLVDELRALREELLLRAGADDPEATS